MEEMGKISSSVIYWEIHRSSIDTVTDFTKYKGS